jgi:hypothetical protein
VASQSTFPLLSIQLLPFGFQKLPHFQISFLNVLKFARVSTRRFFVLWLVGVRCAVGRRRVMSDAVSSVLFCTLSRIFIFSTESSLNKITTKMAVTKVKGKELNSVTYRKKVSAVEITALIPPASLDISTIKQAIPKHCFERSLAKSMGYLLYSASLCYLILLIGWGSWYGSWLFPLNYLFGFEVAGGLNSLLLNTHVALRYSMSILYFTVFAVVQGTSAVGLWIIAHECGHHAFSKYEKLNNFLGWIFHSILLIPYFAWQFSHGTHHRYTANIDKDVVYIPHVVSQDQKEHTDGFVASNEEEDELMDLFEDAGIGAPLLFYILVQVVKTVVIGWPVYLWGGYTGPAAWSQTLKTPYDRLLGKTSHFRTDYPVYD